MSSDFAKGNIINNFIRLAPLILLFISVFNEFDLNYLEIFSLNFPFILIFYWSLRKTELLGYGFIFLAGLINDVVTGFPIGISSFNYLMICGFAGPSALPCTGICVLYSPPKGPCALQAFGLKLCLRVCFVCFVPVCVVYSS